MISTKIKKFLHEKLDLIIPILIYLLVTLLIWPFGEHAVNDDWQFFTHVRYFSEGNLIKNPLIDASFVLQGFIGLFWTKIFGLSFVSLRILTIFFTIIFLYGVYKILKFYNLSKVTTIFTFFAIFIEPLFLTSSYSFMTEIYFITFCIWSVYFFIVGLEKQNKKYLIAAILLGSLSLLIRQFGVVLFVAYLIYFLYKINNKKSRINYIILTIFCFGLTGFYSTLYPQYFGKFSSQYDKLIMLIGSTDEILIKIEYYFKYLTYFSFYLAPLTLGIINKNKRLNIIPYLASIPIALLIFRIDIFDLGNVFHIECLYCETQFKSEVSLFDNIFFKLILSYLIALNLVFIAFKVLTIKVSKEFKNFLDNPFLLISLGMLFIILFVDSFYERYFFNFAIFFILFLAVKLNNKIKPNLLSILVTLLYLLIVIFLNIEFYRSAEIKWQQSLLIRKLADKNGEIFTLGSFYRFILAQETPPYNLYSATYLGKNDCYVQRYFSQDKNMMINILERQKYGPIENPVFSAEKLIINIPKISKNKENIITSQEYNSPIYSLLGIKTYIIGFCEQNVIQKKNIPVIKNYPKNL